MIKKSHGLKWAGLSVITSILLAASSSFAATMGDYCIKPAFIQQNISPNLLLMIDNSSSMFDLANADAGNTNSSGTVTRQPFYCKDETYSSTKSSDYAGYFDNIKAGMYYSYDAANHYFVPVSGSFPSQASCTYYIANKLCITPDANGKIGSTGSTFMAAGDYLNWLTASKFDVEKQILTGGKVASKLCAPITSGSLPDEACNYDTDCPSGHCNAVTTNTFTQAESRGCVGQSFVKIPLSSDFVNFTASQTDPNNPANLIGITFAVRGPVDSLNQSNPSRGGQTYIDIYQGNFNSPACDAAVTDYFNPAVNQTTLANAIQACINYTPTNAQNKNYCALATSQSCTIDNDCWVGVPGKCTDGVTSCNQNSDCPVNPTPTANGACSNQTNAGTSISCTSDANCAAGAISGGHCSNNNTTACSKDTDCPIKINTGRCSKKNNLSCSVDSDCVVTTPAHGNNPASTTDYGPCTGATHYSCSGMDPLASGTCTNPKPTYANYLCNNPAPSSINKGPCINPGQSGAVNTKIALSQTIQTCWTYLSRGQAIGTGDYNRLIGGNAKCDAVYPSWGICTGDTSAACTLDSDCVNSSNISTGPCIHGPNAISSGNPALICGNDYLGRYCTWDPLAKTCTWNIDSAGAISYYQAFCNAQQPMVMDPTDSAATSSSYEQVPALIGGMGLTGQLGKPVGSIPVRVEVPTPANYQTCTGDQDCNSGYLCANGLCKVHGVLQQFDGKIRVGAMRFNFNGSSTEAGTAGVTQPRVCNEGNHDRLCTLNEDCPQSNTCLSASGSAQYNYDGGKIIYDVGTGFCATMTTTTCLTDANCGTGQSCINNLCGTKDTATKCTTKANCSSSQICATSSVGEHTDPNSFINKIDSLKANAWTPLAEGFYDAIGYFAKDPNTGNSSTAIRINTSDFDAAFNPSEYRCQQNYTLLISDGSSTADQNSNVSTLAGTFSTPTLASLGYAAAPANWNSSCPYYGGSTYLPILSHLAHSTNIASSGFSQPPAASRDFITTYVVLNGGSSNGEGGECSALNLFSDTATAGGTKLYFANNSQALRQNLSDVFQTISAQAASGTAASILSNSEGSGANILQAVFYPLKQFDNITVVKWIGEMQNLWYFVDPYIQNSTIREDTVSDKVFNLIDDYVIRFGFSSGSQKTLVQRYNDSNGDGIVTDSDKVGGLIDPDYVKSIWRAGAQLWKRTSARTIYTGFNSTSGSTPQSFAVDGTFDNTQAVWDALQIPAGDNTQRQNLARKLINYTLGTDQADDTPPCLNNDCSYRPRKVTMGICSDNVQRCQITSDCSSGATCDVITKREWKLGDIVSSTPRVQSTVRLNTYNLAPPGGYNDKTYESYFNSNQYQSHGMVYVGANDGMLHAFKLGILSVQSNTFQKATLTLGSDTTDLGEEKWAFIPKNSLPYLKYSSENDYGHLYYVDGRTVIIDASIGDTNSGTCVASSYWECSKPRGGSISPVNSSNDLDATKNTWRTIVISGMGLGGASRNNVSGETCTEGVAGNCVKTPISDLGYSSYFALDVTDPNNPKFLWEFSNNLLGYATSAPAIVRIGDKDKNGRWFAVFGNGPFGPIDKDTNQFMGQSTHELRYFVVDLRTGQLLRTIAFDGTDAPNLDNAFAGTLLGASIDTDRRDPSNAGNYQDDAIYSGYVRLGSDSKWTDGGVVRIMTKEDINPANWVGSKVIEGVGPVTTNIARTQDTRALNKNLWLYFGTGRYYYRDQVNIDDNNTRRSLFAIQEPCYNTASRPGNVLDGNCTTTVTSGSLVNQTNSVSTLGASDKGWRIDLDQATTAEGAERVVTDTVALTNGTVFFTTFKPTLDVCGYGGNSFLWGLKYDTGGQAAANALQGKALIQLSTGEFKEVDLSSAFTDKLNRRMATPMTGKPPADAPPIISNSTNKPVKKILHIREH